MPAPDFAPGAQGNINPAKTYLIKGSTLKKLLKETIFARNDFDVKEDEIKRLISARKAPVLDGLNFNFLLKDITATITGDPIDGLHLGLVQTYEPEILCVRNGIFVPADAAEVDSYSFLSRMTSSDPINGDTGPLFTPAP